MVDSAEDSFFMTNFIGGTMPGRYIPSQIPFAGFNGITPVRDFVGVLNLDFRATLVKNLYATLSGTWAIDADSMMTSFEEFNPNWFGVSAEVAYNSVIGPLRARAQWSSAFGLTAYVGFGFDF